MEAIDETMVRAEPEAGVSPPRGRGIPRRWIEGILFVAAWTALGWAMELDANAYLLLGIPLTVAFQRAVRGEPIRAMWVRESPPMGRGWVMPAAILGLLPAVSLVAGVAAGYWIIAGWMLAALIGAIGAGYALRHLRRSMLRPFGLCQLTAGLMGVGLAIAARSMGPIERPALPMMGLHDFFLYFPAVFALEEVSFRGMLDSHLHRPGERFGLTSALLGSILWGIWHLPTLPAPARDLEALIGLVIVHVLIGVPLAIAWRRTGNLAVPGFTHAMIDAVRNALRVV